jgi:single-strand DNA-binding protein
MASGYSRVILIGNLTRDPELRYTPKGTAVAKITVAVNRRWYDDSGQLKEETSFIDADAFGKIAENIGQFFKKGSPIFIEGRLRQDTWEDKQTNQKRSKLVVVVENFVFMERNKDAASNNQEDRKQNGPNQNHSNMNAAPDQNDLDENVPF